ncbi:MAG: hypothetical protein K9J74_08540 [Sulfuritalea sp.]|nr:hypothetical protein [Sulfuritalea sp.]
MLSDAVSQLNALLSVEFQRKLLGASLTSLEEASNPLSFNNFCTGFRELVRHVLSDLAPDAEIKDCAWYEPDKTSRTGITRAHAIAYAVQGGLSDRYLSDVLQINVSDEKKALLTAVNQLNKYTHVNESTFGVDSVLATEKAELAVLALANILELAQECQAELVRALEQGIHNEVVAAAIGETIGSIDELASHHCVEEIDVEEVNVIKVDSKHIHLQASGTIGVELQWGSNGDLRRGEGAVGNDTFPFTCELQSHVDSPDEVEVVGESLCVDTSSWWDGYYDEA